MGKGNEAMGLWIRSQDKKVLLEINDIEVFKSTSGEGQIYGCSISRKAENAVILGQYKTEERAMKVVDEIHKLILYAEHYLHSGVNAYGCQHADYAVYQMPEQEAANEQRY